MNDLLRLFILIILFIAIYLIGWIVTGSFKIKKSKIWLWFIISWIVWVVCFLIYGLWFQLGTDSPEASDFRYWVDMAWLGSFFIPLHHALFVLSIIVLVIKNYKSKRNKKMVN